MGLFTRYYGRPRESMRVSIMQPQWLSTAAVSVGRQRFGSAKYFAQKDPNCWTCACVRNPELNPLPKKNKCIGDDTKAAARRSPNCIRKTKKYVVWNVGICFIAEILLKNCLPRKILLKSGNGLLSYGQKAIFKKAYVRHFEF